MIVFLNVSSPSTVNMLTPIFDIHSRKKGALFRRQPVVPPNSDIEDDAVSRANKTAKAKLSIGVMYESNFEVQNTSPSDNPPPSASRCGFGISGNNGMFKFPQAF